MDPSNGGWGRVDISEVIGSARALLNNWIE